MVPCPIAPVETPAFTPEVDWRAHAPLVAAINRLKAERKAVILAHNYQTPEIFHGVADLTGDSLELARLAAGCDAEVLVVCGVHFMAETAKLLNPDKTVLIPDPEAGCSLAAAIGGEEIRRLRRRYPGVPVVTYVNTTAEAKAESDICCTSANAQAVVESLGSRRVIFLPDEYLGRYVAARSRVEIILGQGHCEVHEKFTAADLAACRRRHGDVAILAHPECPPDVLAGADFVGSTAGMIRHLATHAPRRVFLATECSMTDNLAVQFPGIEFIRPDHFCPHMRRITLPGILRALETLQPAVEIDPVVAGAARRAVQRMLELNPQPAPAHG